VTRLQPYCAAARAAASTRMHCARHRIILAARRCASLAAIMSAAPSRLTLLKLRLPHHSPSGISRSARRRAQNVNVRRWRGSMRRLARKRAAARLRMEPGRNVAQRLWISLGIRRHAKTNSAVCYIVREQRKQQQDAVLKVARSNGKRWRVCAAAPLAPTIILLAVLLYRRHRRTLSSPLSSGGDFFARWRRHSGCRTLRHQQQRVNTLSIMLRSSNCARRLALIALS